MRCNQELNGKSRRPERPAPAGAGKEEHMKRLSIRQMKKEEAIGSVKKSLVQ
jgi:hypothetical protein